MRKLVFRGVLAKGFDKPQAVANLAKLLKLDEAQVEAKLFPAKAVTLKRVSTEADANKWQRAFAQAGAVLDIVPDEPGMVEAKGDPATAAQPESKSPSDSPSGGTTAYPEAPAQASPQTDASSPQPEPSKVRQKSRKGFYIGLGFAANLVIGGIIIALWFTRPLWQIGELSAGDQALGTAMVTEDSFAIARVDVRRVNALEGLSGDRVDLNSLPVGDGLLDSLARAGLNVRADVDMLWLAGYVADDKPGSVLLASGRFDAERLQAWLAERYEVEQSLSDGAVFRMVDAASCEKGELIRAFVSENLVVVGDVERVALVLERIAQNTPVSERVKHWFAVSESQLVSAAIFAPENIGHSVSGLAGMMLGGMGEAASAADGVYLGVESVVLPPGVEFQLLLESVNRDFLDQAKTSFDERLADMRATAEANYPETLKFYDRLSVRRTEGGLQAAVRFDKNLRTEVSQWVNSMFSGSISAGGSGPAEVAEEIDDNPPVYAQTSMHSLKLNDSSAAQSDPFFYFSTSAGPFQLGVQSLEVNAEQQVMINLESRGYDLPNLPSRGAAATMVLTDIVDTQGNSLLLVVECGTDTNREAVDIGQAISYSNYVDGESVSGMRVNAKATYVLRPYASASDVDQLRGYIEYPLTLDVETINLQQPLAGQTIERDGFSLRFTQAGPNAISYQYQGEPGKLLHVAALNSAGQPLESGGAMWGGAFFGQGQTANVDIKGEVASVNVILAKQVQHERYEFVVDSIIPEPDSDTDYSFAREPIEWSQKSWQNIYTGNAPEVTYGWNKPIAENDIGPMRLAVYEASSSQHFGTRFTGELFLEFNLPITSLLSSGQFVVESLVTGSGENIDTEISSALSFALDGGMWMNGVYQKDEDSSWVKARVDWRDRELKPDALQELVGYVMLSLPVSTEQQSMPFQLGDGWRGSDLELTLSKLEAGAAYLSYAGDLSSVVAIEGLKDGESVTDAAEFHSMFGESSIKLPLKAMPDELLLTLVTESNQQRFPFRLSMPAE
ncbi:hypothetical protein QWI17_08125 [Gilvimarinus sp. SDUM040013]|uniref:SPOR domain-containing protein n=1 Tax=Gilvimarinus gilvus TaxID=3058038 RepID=A0ABU4S2E8_9GAMM|nr:hypothetical protein [Gilvimarinus sp. SDUM040013]MDO3385801.1 hypothetical protein [Gilvimarinus sp. SDUM040013]MDX6850637.1 hypothetical protein [Gilvimarinus sp. SDUM040013]